MLKRGGGTNLVLQIRTQNLKEMICMSRREAKKRFEKAKDKTVCSDRSRDPGWEIENERRSGERERK